MNPKKELLLPVHVLKRHFAYDPETGILTRKTRIANQVAGKVVGSPMASGYLQMQHGKVKAVVHCVAYAIHHGEWAPNEIDHINGIRTDNRICNLRAVTRQQNAKNLKKRVDNTSGFKGVSWCRSHSRWNAFISIGGKSKNLGGFKNIDDAAAAYRRASREIHGEFERAM